MDQTLSDSPRDFPFPFALTPGETDKTAFIKLLPPLRERVPEGFFASEGDLTPLFGNCLICRFCSHHARRLLL